MSNKLSDMIVHIPGLDAAEVFVLYRLADHAGPDGRCFPSIALIARETRMHTRTVRYAIQSLEAFGLIQCQRSKGHRTQYFLQLENAIENGIDRERASIDKWGRARCTGDFPAPVQQEQEPPPSPARPAALTPPPGQDVIPVPGEGEPEFATRDEYLEWARAHYPARMLTMKFFTSQLEKRYPLPVGRHTEPLTVT